MMDTNIAKLIGKLSREKKLPLRPKYALDQRYLKIVEKKLGDEEFYQAMLACGLMEDYPVLRGEKPTASDFTRCDF